MPATRAGGVGILYWWLLTGEERQRTLLWWGTADWGDDRRGQCLGLGEWLDALVLASLLDVFDVCF